VIAFMIDRATASANKGTKAAIQALGVEFILPITFISNGAKNPGWSRDRLHPLAFGDTVMRVPLLWAASWSKRRDRKI